MSKKLITFSLWGEDPKYIQGALRNAELAPRIYPGWTCRFYADMLIVPMPCLRALEAMNHVELVDMPIDMDGWKGMFTRFLPAAEDNVDVFISRDCDSRLGRREAEAVQEWMDSPMLIHVMRDHPYHTTPILGGMWGAKRDAIPDMEELMYRWDKEDRWQTDQEFLRDMIWPRYYHKVMAHDDWNRFPVAKNMRFPRPREEDEFVGAIIGAHEEKMHPAHHEML